MITLYENATQVTVTGEAQEIATLVNDFKFRPESYFFAVSFQRYQLTQGKEGWDGFIYPLYPLSATAARALRGYKEDIIRAAELSQFKVNFDHLLEYPFAGMELDDVRPDLIAGDYTLDTNQRRCILEWLRAGIGFNKVTVGGSKTATFAGAAALIKEHYVDARFLYVTPSERLVRQVTKEMKKFLPRFDVGQCGGGYRQFAAKDMVVCTVAMLSKHFHALKLQGWFNSFMAVLYDEVHHCGSKTSKQILMAIPAYFRLGASDTGKENDATRAHEIKGLFGPLLTEVAAAPLIQEGRLAQPHLYVVDIPAWCNRFKDVPFRPVVGSSAYALLDGQWIAAEYAGQVYEEDAEGHVLMRSVRTAKKDAEDNWITEEQPVIVPGKHRLKVDGQEVEIESRWCLLNRLYDRAIIQFKSRNEMVVNWVKYFHGQRWPTVVVATRTAHVYILEALLNAAIPGNFVRVLIGEDSPNERDAAFAWFKETPGSVLVTPLVKEGISINEIQAMVVADHVSNYEVARQIIGRAMRPKKNTDNRAHVVWFYDKQNTVLRRGCALVFNHLERLEGYLFYYPCAGPETVFGSTLHERKLCSAPVQPASRRALRD